MQIKLTSNLTVQSNTTGSSWVSAPDPSYRNTYNILSSCVSTLVICIWSAIHLDVPVYRQGTAASLLRSVGWKLGALVVPELFLWAAFVQLLNARGLCQQAQSYLPVKSPRVGADEKDVESVPLDPLALKSAVDKRPRLHKFTLTHGFYATMGGYAFDFSTEDGKTDGPAFLPNARTRITITASGIHFLMKHAPDLVPDLPKAHITDRSDGSSLSKTLLLLQVTWFCANCIARLAQNLPLSLLEVTTVAHGVCTLLTYAVWWAKPLNIAEPTVLCGPEAQKACALMKMCSKDSQNVFLGLLSFETRAEMYYVADSTLAEATGECISISVPPQSSTVSLAPKRQCLEGTNFTPEPIIVEDEDLDRRVVYRSKQRPWYMRRQDPDENATLDNLDVCRWKLASEALRSYGLTRDQAWSEAQEALLDYLTDHSTRNIEANSGSYTPQLWHFLLIYCVLPALYGSAHFLARNTQFPSPAEKTLWRVATVVTTFWGVVLICVLVVVLVVWGVWKAARTRSPVVIEATPIMTAIQIPMALLYAAATGYLFVESIRQILYLEPDAYQMPAWSSYWPHFG